MTPWDIATLVTKLLIYGGAVGFVGGIFMYFNIHNEISKNHIKLYCRLLLILGGTAVILNFFVQVGAFAEEGMAGMFEPVYLALLWQSSVGDAVIYRIIAFVLGLVILVLWAKPDRTTKYHGFIIMIWFVGLMLLGRSFSLLGHTSELALATKWLLSLHVILIAWWLGALWPLRQACHHLDLADIYKLMHLFGIYASYAVAILVLCGFILTYQLLGSIDAMFTTSYGQILLSKLGLVVGMLALAAYHKSRLVPSLLTQEQGANILARSIVWEMLIGFTILIVTSWLTTIVGPIH